jgi:hypothetical protein
VTELSEKYITDLTVEMPDAYHIGDVIKGMSCVSVWPLLPPRSRLLLTRLGLWPAVVTSVSAGTERIKLSVLHSRHAIDGDTFLVRKPSLTGMVVRMNHDTCVL